MFSITERRGVMQQPVNTRLKEPENVGLTTDADPFISEQQQQQQQQWRQCGQQHNQTSLRCIAPPAAVAGVDSMSLQLNGPESSADRQASKQLITRGR